MKEKEQGDKGLESERENARENKKKTVERGAQIEEVEEGWRK